MATHNARDPETLGDPPPGTTSEPPPAPPETRKPGDKLPKPGEPAPPLVEPKPGVPTHPIVEPDEDKPGRGDKPGAEPKRR